MKSTQNSLSRLISLSRKVQDLNLAFEKKFDLSLTQWLVLDSLRDLPGCTAQTLATALDMQPSSLTQILKRLTKKKLVHIASDSKDLRKKILLLTREGNLNLETLKPHLKRHFAKIDYSALSKVVCELEETVRSSAHVDLML